MMNPSGPLKVCFVRLKCRSNAQAGHVAVIAALCMTALLGIFAFLANVGFLYADKNRYQNAVEAAAMAGVSQLCGEDPEGTAMDILLQNLFPDGYEGEEPPEGYTVDIATGYYDESGEADLSGSSAFGYRSFVEAENMPTDVYANSLLVRLSINHNAILPGLVGRDEVPLQVAAVAYLKRYGMLALGMEAGDGIEIGRWDLFNDNEPIFRYGDIHANRDIVFENSAPDIDQDTVTVTAGGTVSGYGEGISDADILEIPPVDAYLENLYQNADRILDESDFPETPGTDWSFPDDDNGYRWFGGSEYSFAPHRGDHGGAIYYFNFSNSSSYLTLANRFDQNDRITNLTIATNTSVRFRSSRHGGTTHYWGGDGHTVIIAALEDIDLGSDVTSFGPRFYTANNCNFDGTIFRAGGDVSFWASSWYSGTFEGLRKLRMIADGKIYIPGRSSLYPMEFDFSFGPPCPPSIVKLGRLETTVP